MTRQLILALVLAGCALCGAFRFDVETLSVQPRVFRIPNFLNQKETELLTNLATPKLTKSQVCACPCSCAMFVVQTGDGRKRHDTPTFRKSEMYFLSDR